MSCDATGGAVVSVRALGKRYRLYDRPEDRLKEHLRWRARKPASREFWALRGVSFEVARAERFGVIGRNGSGKSTLLQLIAGTLRPTEGDVTVRGRVAALLELGSGFNPQFTGRENVLMNGAVLGLSPAEIAARFDAIAAFADIDAFIDQPVKTYSSGMLVRLAFAVATTVDADLLLVDEALAVGDIFFRQKCYRRLDELQRRGTAVVLVSHAMTEIEQFCSRALLLDRGHPRVLAPAPEAVKRYYLLEQELRTGADAVAGAETASRPASEAADAGTPPGPAGGDAGGVRPPEAAGAVSTAAGAHLPELVAASPAAWPAVPAEARFDLSASSHVTNGWARCCSLALTDAEGRPCRAFDQGATAIFDVEYELDRAIEVPNAGLEILNEKGIVVHGKNTLEYGSAVPTYISAGAHIRVRQQIVLGLAVGDYTFTVGLACLTAHDYARRAELAWPQVESRLLRLCHLPTAGRLTIVLRRRGVPVQLLHHGVADLAGRADVAVLEAGHARGFEVAR